MNTSVPFLTRLDPEIEVKGSIDPLGMMALWSRLGRELVGNLTLVASSVRGFTTLLLGYHFARQSLGGGDVDPRDMIERFLRFEQLAAYSRIACAEEEKRQDRSVLGIQRASARWRDGNGRVAIGAERETQILSNQKSYGLWGLFSVAAEDSGLIDRTALRLTPAGQRIVDEVAIPVLVKRGLRDGAEITSLVRSGRSFEPLARHSRVGRALGELHAPTVSGKEQEIYAEHLVYGGPAFEDGRQQRLWDLITEINDANDLWGAPLDMEWVSALIRAAERNGDSVVARALRNIREFERVAAPFARVFSFLQDSEGREVDAIAADIGATWGRGLAVDLDGLSEALEVVEDALAREGRDRFADVGKALKAGDWGRVIRLVIEHNAAVMGRRGGSAWVVLEAGKLVVRYQQEPRDLPSASEIASQWEHPYFLTSLESVGGEVFNRFEVTRA